MQIRLNKFLVDAGVCSRREADRLIEQGLVTVDGTPAVLGQKIEGSENLRVRGKKVVPVSTRVYIAYYKPIGIICTSDPNAQDNIIEAIGYPDRLFHIGRLDVASSGLILLTNDGDIVNRILRSEEKHEKEYSVTVDKNVTPEFLQHLRDGVFLDNQKTLPAKVVQTSHNIFSITIIEGRNRQIRRMCEELGFNVVSLRRDRIMHIKLGKLTVGEWRHLTPEEERVLLESTGLLKKVKKASRGPDPS